MLLSVLSLDLLVGTEAPPVVAGVGDENLEPKHKQIMRELVNGAKHEGRPYLEAERSPQVKRSSKNHTSSFVSLRAFGLFLNC